MKSVEQRFSQIVDALLPAPGLSLGAGNKGFGSHALRFHGRIVAMVNSSGEFTIKLPRIRVDDLVAKNFGRRFEPRTGRPMKEWLVVDAQGYCDWLVLAQESIAFASKAKRRAA